jgi:hypothetical protein
MSEIQEQSVANVAPITPVVPDQEVSGGQILVRSVTGSATSFEYRANMTVAELKQSLFDNQRIPVTDQRLIFNAKQLDDNMTLGACGIVPDSTIHLVLRIKGGF